MAAKRINRMQWHGFSTDEMPLAVPEGATYYTLDTGEEWMMFDGAWILQLETINTRAKALAF